MIGGIFIRIDVFIKTMIQGIQQQIKSNLKFEEIFDNLDECVIIVEKTDLIIEYVNRKFFSIFSKEIMKEWEHCFDRINEE